MKGVSAVQFVNPYNFVPLSGKKPNRRAYQEGCSAGSRDTYQGVIAYTLETRSPLFIPNTSNSEIFSIKGADPGHKSYEFFSYDSLTGEKHERSQPCKTVPVIPGSEIRGMLRSYFEILTNSCLSAVDDDVILSKRIAEPFQAALLVKTGKGFQLYPAKDCLLRTKEKNDLNIEIDGWEQAKDGRYKRQCYIQDSLEEGQKVYVRLIGRGGKIKPLVKQLFVECNQKECYLIKEELGGQPDGKSIYEGYLIKGEAGPQMDGKKEKQNKHCAHVFVKGSGNPLSMDNIMINLAMDSLDKVLAEYEGNQESLYTEYKKLYGYFKQKSPEGSCFPVYYSSVRAFVEIEGIRKEKTYYMLSPACITREVYQTRLKHFLGEHRTCTDPKNLCPACRMFGILGKNQGNDFAVSSKIRFTDLTLSEEMDNDQIESLYEKPVTLPPLSSPKLNNMEFYLKKPAEDAWFWTYDYYIDSKGKLHPNQGGINGRKFYWHKIGINLENIRYDKAGMEEEPDKLYSKLNMTVRPLRESKESGAVFQGKVYFSKLTKTELDQLIYLMETGDRQPIGEKTHGYKLGAAKPLGFGSVALHVDQVDLMGYEADSATKVVRRMDRQSYGDYREPDFDKEIVKGFQKMTDFGALEEKPEMSYPRSDGKKEIYEWFVWNHAGYKHNEPNGKVVSINMPNKRNQMVYRQYMQALEPALCDTDEKLTRSVGGSTGRVSGVAGVVDDALKGYIAGHVKFFNIDRGFGFVVSNHDGEEAYLHCSVISGELSDYKEGVAVRYKVRPGKKGPKVADIVLAE